MLPSRGPLDHASVPECHQSETALEADSGFRGLCLRRWITTARSRANQRIATCPGLLTLQVLRSSCESLSAGIAASMSREPEPSSSVLVGDFYSGAFGPTIILVLQPLAVRGGCMTSSYRSPGPVDLLT
jgi:hypothetical protein